MNLALFISGELGFRVFEHLMKSQQMIKCIFTDSKSTQIISYANVYEVPVFVGNPRTERALKFVEPYQIDIMLSVNYIFIIERQLFSKSKLAINLHGSLLPKYRGRTPHIWAIINNEVITGITAHLIDDGCDTGDIIKQIEISIGENDTGADILEKFNQLYLPCVDSLLEDFEAGNMIATPQHNENATFFGKRSPEDGHINWCWHKERIKNWVRAQANPYPGAFTFLNNQKIIIDKVSFTEIGFHSSDQNGLIVSLNPNCVKTPNGVVELKKIRNLDSSFTLKVGQIFV